MRQLFIPLFTIGLLALIGTGCDSLTNDERGTVTLTGIVVDANDEGVANAFIRVQPQDLLVETDEAGEYTLDVDIDSTMNLVVLASKNGYSSATTTILALADRTIDVPTLRITASAGFVEESGQAANIILRDLSAQAIGVKEAGSEEIATITFQVTDSTGQPLSLSQAVNLSFAFGEQPGGGEFLYPTTVKTDNNGEARVNLSAGTRAGLIQVIASATVDGETIRSNPAAMAIHGGHPDQNHFTLGPEKFNFPGLVRFGVTNQISVLVGDQYSNPARPNSAVYFNSSHGVIQGSGLTSENGAASVILYSGNPLPDNTGIGENGIATIQATTADIDNNPVTAQIPVLFSGSPIITLTQTGSSNDPFARRFDYTVMDYLGNPMGQGTTITVRAGGVKVEAVGDVAVELGDTGIVGNGDTVPYSAVTGAGITDFSFSVVERTIADIVDPPSLDRVTITVGGPNGRLQVTYGANGVSTSTEGATVEQVGADTFVIKAHQP